MSAEANAEWEDLAAAAVTPIVKSVPPAWARRIPKRTIILGAVAATATFLYWILQSTVAMSPANSDPTAFLAPWRYALLASIMLWVAVVSGVSSLWTWLLHVRDKENLQRLLAFQQRARTNTGGK